MSRVFVSCSYRDRAVGQRLGNIVRSLGHDAVDDQDQAQGKAWWNEVVGRIEESDVFVAVASPAYADAHACRLAAKHAASTGLPVVRVDLDRKAVPDCHPAVAAAVGVPFAPEDPEAIARLANALNGSPPDVPAPAAAAAPGPEATSMEREQPGPPYERVVPPNKRVGRFNALEVRVAIAVMLVAVGLLYLGLQHGPEPSPTPAPAPSGTPTPGTGVPTTDAAATALLAGVEVADSPRLPVSSCQASADAVTCRNPAPNISTVVLTPYQSPAELYAAYTAEVESLSGEPMPENAGNCSNWASEGEVGWNLDKGHTLDFSVAQQENGGLDPASESAGRVFCTDSQKVMSLVWTQDPGLLVTVTGQPSELVVTWWSDVHLQLACAGGEVGSGCAES